MPLRADSGVAVERAEADADRLRILRIAAEERRAVEAAERLLEASSVCPRADMLRARDEIQRWAPPALSAQAWLALSSAAGTTGRRLD